MGLKTEYFPQSVPHPGLTLAEKLAEMGMGPKEFAVRTGKPEKTITAILKGNSSITPDMSIQFENVTKIPAHFWLNCQVGFDEYLSREKQKKVLEEARVWADRFPIIEMIQRGWLDPEAAKVSQTASLLSFFGVANPKAWEDYYINQALKVVFRISLATTKDPFAVSAFLRQGEIQGETLTSEVYSDKGFKDALVEIKKNITRQPEDFFQGLQSICLSAGVKVVYTKSLKNAPIKGCTRWILDSPLIQLSDSLKSNTNFWFTFFHEAGHILLHGKKDIFLENTDSTNIEKQEEKEADEFALKFMH